MRILLAIPCYNCAPQIKRVFAHLIAAFPEMPEIRDILVIDNRSVDSTVEFATALSSQLADVVTIIRNNENYGLGGSHKIAFQAARHFGADWLGVLHGDAQADAREIKLLIAAARRATNPTTILGARFHPHSRREGYSMVRTLGNLGLNLCYTLLTSHRTFDLGSGLNLFNVSDFPPDVLSRCSDGFTFNMDLLLSCYRRGKSVEFVPITWSEEDQRSNASALKVGGEALLTLARWRLGLERPIVLRQYSFSEVLRPKGVASLAPECVPPAPAQQAAGATARQ